MGTYTANKNLYMPTIGEQGWGELINGNYQTIDTFLKPITVSGSTYTFTGNHVGNQSGGSISATSITNSGTLTQTGTSTFTGKITANGGIGTKALTATSISNSGTLTQTGTSTFTGKITANGGVNDYEARITAIENKIGTGTYIANVKVPIIAKFTTTNENMGIVSHANSTSFTYPLGISFTNMNDTYNVTFGAFNNTGGRSPTISFCAKNILTNTDRVIATREYTYNSQITVTYSLYMYEAPYMTTTVVNLYGASYTKPAIYIGSP